MITTETRIYFNEMGDGYDEVVLMYNEEEKNVSIFHVGRFYTDMHSTVDVTDMNMKGYKNA